MDDGARTEALRWRFSRAAKDRQSFGREGLICHAEEVIVAGLAGVIAVKSWEGGKGNLKMNHGDEVRGLI